MNLVSQMQCKKDFAAFCKQHRIPVHRSPVYWGRVYSHFASHWARQRGLKKTK